MRKNFKYLFEDRKIFGFYSDELFVAALVGFFFAAPVYLVSYYADVRVLQKLGGLLLVAVLVAVALVVLSVMKVVRGSDDKTFYVKLVGRNEAPKTLKGRLTKVVLYLMAFERLKGKGKITRTRNYSP